MSIQPSDAITNEVAAVVSLTKQMLDAYRSWGSRIVIGDVQQMLYTDMLDFVNFRMETIQSCLLLIEHQAIADSLGLSRSVLEHYLLFILMCRGRKFFRLQDLTKLTESEFKQRLREELTDLEDKRSRGETNCIEIRKYPRAKRHLMYVFEGLKSREDPDFIVPIHYFHFQDFVPETMRLRDEAYFRYPHEVDYDAEAKSAVRRNQEETTSSYKHYLSYDALLQCLELNDLMSSAEAARIEAHYTFLGRYLHPTNRAARDLHNRNNVFSARTEIGLNQDYTATAFLLAALYTCYLTAGLLNEVASLLEGAPQKYIADPGTGELRMLTSTVVARFPYFWFLFNDPPLYDRFYYCIHYATDDELREWNGYAGVPVDRVPFEPHIYQRLCDGLGGWSNVRLGTYMSPIASQRL